MTDSDLLTYAETSAKLRLSDSSVRRLSRFGVLEEVQVGPRAVRIRAESVDRLLAYGYDPEGREAR